MVQAVSLRSLPLNPWQDKTWQDYTQLRDDDGSERIQLFFDQGWLWVEMGAEGINHANVSDLLTMLFFIWATLHPEQTWTSLGRCLLEKEPLQAAAPDLMLYQGEPYPRWQSGEPRRIDLHPFPAPALVGKISDTTLPIDLDEKKQLYAAMGITEYWVVDVRGKRVFGFQLQESGRYQTCTESQVLAGLPFALLQQALTQLESEPNTRVAAGLAEQIKQFQLS